MAKMVEPDNDDVENVEEDCATCDGTGNCQNCSDGEDSNGDECTYCNGSGDCEDCDGSGTES